MTKELAGEVAIVTGGSRGIGLAVARELAEAGARVALLARDGERAALAAAGLPGEGHAGIACDVSDPEAARAALARVEEALGPVGILVNNAGVTRDNLLMRISEEDWDTVLDTNLKGAFNCIRAVSRGMMKRRRGVVVNVSSVVGLMGNAGQANYAASKAGLHGLTRSVARELASRGIRCNAVAPGYVRTDMTAELTGEQTDALQERIPLGRLGDPEDIAPLVRFLAGPGGRYITGQIIAVDGGMAM
ncbi:MAG: 3-oxoacyl-[acyl-carrier-protein] reductase [Longimicrobiales bacterium]|nr:3-oxoacyl-[acyl-carrier-protein] reductase [Longimicrobiales bacterium]